MIVPEGMTPESVFERLGSLIFMLRDGGESSCTNRELQEMNAFLMSVGLIDYDELGTESDGALAEVE